MRSSASTAVRQLQQRLHGGASAPSSSSTGAPPPPSTPTPPPGSAGSLARTAARNRAAGARLAPLTGTNGNRNATRGTGATGNGGPSSALAKDAAVANKRSPSSSQSSTQMTCRCASTPRSVSASPPSTAKNVGSSSAVADAASGGFANSTGGMRKPRRPPVAGAARALPARPSVRHTTSALRATSPGSAAPAAASDSVTISTRGAAATVAAPLAPPSSSASRDGSSRRGASAPEQRSADAPPSAAVPSTSVPRVPRGKAAEPAVTPAATAVAACPQPPPPPQQQQQQPQSMLPVSPHDLNTMYYRNVANWDPQLQRSHGNTAAAVATAEVDPLAARTRALLNGNALEHPYTTSLWTQCQADPARALANAEGSSPTGAGTLTAALHAHKALLTQGYFCCARCHAPVCAPSGLWRPQPSTEDNQDPKKIGETEAGGEEGDRYRRGYACFTSVHARGLRVALAIDGCSTAGTTAAPGTHDDEAFRRSPAYHHGGTSGVRGGQSTPVAMVYCTHCDGCLGAVVLLPLLRRRRELFIANSLCLRYIGHESTRADTTGHLLLDSDDGDEEHDAASVNGASDKMTWDAPANGASAMPVVRSSAARRDPTYCFVAQPGATGEGDGADGDDVASGARVRWQVRPADDESESVDENGSEVHWGVGWDTQGGGLHMFDDLDDETLYL